MPKNARIFLVHDDGGSLIAMTEEPYSSEDILQVLLARYPDLIPGDQISPENHRRWLHVCREMPVPGDASEAGRWSLDHLFLDQDGIPTFVECKRGVDTRARREVVAQMLDYAANGVEYWPIERLRQAAAETAAKRGASLDDDIRELMGPQVGGEPADVEEYWSVVESNLRAGRVRLVFVADNTPRELRRLVEFLNSKMADIEVLAVEIKQFRGEGTSALVPRVIGMTEAARSTKSAGPQRPPMDRATSLAACPTDAGAVFEQMLDTAAGRGFTIHWNKDTFAIKAALEGGRPFSFAYGWPDPPTAEFYFAYLPISSEDASGLRGRLLGLGVFQEFGKHGLRAPVTQATRGTVLDAFGVILDEVEKIISARGVTPDAGLRE